MCGWVKWNRNVIVVDLWKEIVSFRLYLLLLTRARREVGGMVSGVPLKRGQPISSKWRIWGTAKVEVRNSIPRAPSQAVGGYTYERTVHSC